MIHAYGRWLSVALGWVTIKSCRRWTKKCLSTKFTISHKSANIFVPNVARLFSRQLCKSVLLCAVFTWHTPNWWKCKLRERILIIPKCSRMKQAYEVLCAKWTGTVGAKTCSHYTYIVVLVLGYFNLNHHELFFVYIVFHVDPASGLPDTINVCVYTCREPLTF